MMSRLDFIKNIAEQAGKLIAKSSPTHGIQDKKGRGNFVTDADLKSEKLITDAIRKNFPNDSILSEETDSDIQHPLNESHLWIIDPIDGTHNFRYRRNYSAVSIGYAEKGILKLAAIYDIFRGDMYWAETGTGSFCNDEKLSVNNKQSLTDITLMTDNSYNPADTRKILKQLAQLNHVPFILMKGSAALDFSEVASGKVDLFYHTSLQPWDNAGGMLLVTEADGVVKKPDGKPATFMDPAIIAGNERLVDLLLKQL